MTLKETYSLQGGKYRIIRVLGQGGFGITYLAEHTLLNTLVCIKEFFPKDYVDREEGTSMVKATTRGNIELVDRLLKRFLSEAKNIYHLNHPGIIRISDIFEENGTAYYVMDYIEGTSFGDLVKKFGALQLDKAKEYISKIADALEYIHSNNMAHFDLKPDNIMLRVSDDMPVIIDFGLSKQYNRSGDAMTSVIVGISKGYSPMEQYSEESLTTFSPRIDVYSLGATAYTMFTGRVPPESRLLIRSEILLPENIPAHITSAVQWAMKPFPEDRCPSPKDFVKALNGTGRANHVVSNSQFAPKTTVGMSQPTVKTSVNKGNRKPKSVAPPTKPGNAGRASVTKKKSSNNKVLWIILGIIAIFALSFGVTFALLTSDFLADNHYDNSSPHQTVVDDEANAVGEMVVEKDDNEVKSEFVNPPQLNGLPAKIATPDYAQERDGKYAFYYKGSLTDDTGTYPIMVCFMVAKNGNKMTAEYKNVSYNVKMPMTVDDYSDDSILLVNNKNNFSISLGTDTGGNLTGTAYHGSKILSAVLSPTLDVF